MTSGAVIADRADVLGAATTRVDTEVIVTVAFVVVNVIALAQRGAVIAVAEIVGATVFALAHRGLDRGRGGRVLVSGHAYSIAHRFKLGPLAIR